MANTWPRSKNYVSFAAPDSPPTAVAVGAESPYEVRVTWSPPTTPNGIITQYRLSATLNGSPLPSIIVPRDDLTRVIDGLTPFGIVTVMISASTIVGEGPSSPTVTLRTLEARKYTFNAYQLAICWALLEKLYSST